MDKKYDVYRWGFRLLHWVSERELRDYLTQYGLRIVRIEQIGNILHDVHVSK